MRKTDAELQAMLDGPAMLSEDARELITEVLEARERGTTATVDRMSQMKEGEPAAYKDGLFVVGSGIHIVSWCPDDEAKLPPTQVHIIQDLSKALSQPIKSVIRLKSGVGVDSLINALYSHRRDVWPGYQGLNVGKKEPLGPRLKKIMDEIAAERQRQDAKWGDALHQPCTYMTILMEEVGEAAQAALENEFGGKGNLREELVQVAAVAVRMLELIDRSIDGWA